MSESTAQKRFIRCPEGHVFDANAAEACPVCGATVAAGHRTATAAASGAGTSGLSLDKPPVPPRNNHMMIGAVCLVGLVAVAGSVYWYAGLGKKPVPTPVPPVITEIEEKSRKPASPPRQAEVQPKPAPIPAPPAVPDQATTALGRVEAVAAAMRALRTAPPPASFAAWTGGRAPTAADLPEGAKTLLQIGGISKEALGLYLRMEASRASVPLLKIKLLEQAFALGKVPAAALEIAETLKTSDPVRAFAFAREAGDRGVVAGDGLAVALARTNPSGFPLPDAVRQRFYQRSEATVKEAGAGLDTTALPDPTYALCNKVLNGDTAAITEAKTRGREGDLEAAGCFTTALLVDFNNPPPRGEPAPARPYAALAREVTSRMTPSTDPKPGFADAMAGDFAMGAGGSELNPAEAAVWFLRAASLKPDISLPSSEAPVVARYAEAMATLRPPASDAVAVVLDPLRAAIVEPAPAPKTAKQLDIGIAVFPVPAKLAADNGLSAGQGALVGRFVKDSAAGAQGLLVGDIVTAVNGRPVENADNLSTLVEQTANGKPIAVDFIRNGQRRALQIIAAAVQVAPPPPAQARDKRVTASSADPSCWSDTLPLAEKRSRSCLTAEVKAGPGSHLATLADLPHVRLSCCDGASPRFEEALMPDDRPEGLAARWTALMPDRSILMIDGYESPAAAQQAATYAAAIADRAEKSALSERYQKAIAAMGGHVPPAQAKIDSAIVTVESGAYPLPGDRGKIQLYTRCFSMTVKRSYVLCNAYLPGSVAVATYLRQTNSTDGKVVSAPMQLLSALLAEGIIGGSLPASPPP